MAGSPKILMGGLLVEAVWIAASYAALYGTGVVKAWIASSLLVFPLALAYLLLIPAVWLDFIKAFAAAGLLSLLGALAWGASISGGPLAPGDAVALVLQLAVGFLGLSTYYSVMRRRTKKFHPMDLPVYG